MRRGMADKRLECDLVMRGGIASGLVYPTAIETLSRTYRFRSIGGTSAGAIAAAATAAAEYGRREGSNPRSFERLAQIPAELAERTRGTSRLAGLFRPQKDTARVYRVLWAAMQSKNLKGIDRLLAITAALFRAFPLAGILGALAGPLALAILSPVVSLLLDNKISLDNLPLLLERMAHAALIVVILGIPVLLMLTRAPTLPQLAITTVIVLGLVTVLSLVIREPAMQPDLLHYLIAMPLMLLMIVLMVGGMLVGAGHAAARRAGKVIPKNNFGLCTGLNPGDKRGPGITEWMHGVIQELAGRKPDDPPLTAADLDVTGSPEAASGVTGIYRVHIALMTTNVTRGISHCFPRLEGMPGGDGDGGWKGELYFRESELRRLLPESVVAWMVSRARGVVQGKAPHDRARSPDAEPYLRLPAPGDLPVVFGARMSMSFPLLLSAVPLYAPVDNPGAAASSEMRRCWFSDGGITSNFPIHFFDAPVPRRPTFGISLAYEDTSFLGERVPPSIAVSRSDEWERHKEDVLMAAGEAESRKDFVRYSEFDRPGVFQIGGFFRALFDTARNWGDAELMDMPGYKDRIVHVRLKNHEGGLNLDMPADVVAALAAKGRIAGAFLAARFAPDPDAGKAGIAAAADAWNDHRWVRYRSFMSSLEELSRNFARRWPDTDGPQGTLSIANLVLVSGDRTGPDAFPWHSAEQHQHALEMTEAMVSAAERWTGPHQTFDAPESSAPGGAPRPKARMRVMPPDDAAPLSAR
jgi:predicted acylesterase/phospholipase RssA